MKNKLLLVSVVIAILAMAITLGSCDNGTTVRFEKVAAPTNFTVTPNDGETRYDISFTAVNYVASYQFVYRIVNSGITGQIYPTQVAPSTAVDNLQYRYYYASIQSLLAGSAAGTYQVQLGIRASDSMYVSDIVWAPAVSVTVTAP